MDLLSLFSSFREQSVMFISVHWEHHEHLFSYFLNIFPVELDMDHMDNQ